MVGEYAHNYSNAPPSNEDVPLLEDMDDLDEPIYPEMEVQYDDESDDEQVIPAWPYVLPPLHAFIRSREELAAIEAAVLYALYDSGPGVLQGDGVTIYLQDSTFVAKARQPDAYAAPPTSPIDMRNDLLNETIDGMFEPSNELYGDHKDGTNSDSDEYEEDVSNSEQLDEVNGYIAMDENNHGDARNAEPLASTSINENNPGNAQN